MNTLSPRSIKAQLKTKIIGRKIHLFGELDSTNSEAYRMALEGAEEGEVIIADCQLRGKGRLGRPWHSPPGVNLYVSIILRPPIPPRNASLITIMAAVATAKATKGISGLQPRIKWPNDILINKKKVAGLLNEMKLLGEKVEFIILGTKWPYLENTHPNQVVYFLLRISQLPNSFTILSVFNKTF